MNFKTNDEIFGPRNIKITDVLITSAGSFISGVIGSVFLLFITFLVSGIIDVPGNFKQENLGLGGNTPIFPFVLSFITFIVSVVVSVITYNFLHLIDAERYKKTIIHLGQISLFSIITYIFLVPVYVYIGMIDYKNIMYIFIIHVLIQAFGEAILLEILNNYRYILLGFYGSFIGLFLTGIVAFFIFFLFPEGYARLLSLILLLPLINGLIFFFKGLFELVYYKYFILTAKDNLGDIFDQIIQEEKEQLRDAINENNTY